jgi:hypothetical protein
MNCEWCEIMMSERNLHFICVHGKKVYVFYGYRNERIMRNYFIKSCDVLMNRKRVYLRLTVNGSITLPMRLKLVPCFHSVGSVSCELSVPVGRR